MMLNREIWYKIRFNSKKFVMNKIKYLHVVWLVEFLDKVCLKHHKTRAPQIQGIGESKRGERLIISFKSTLVKFGHYMEWFFNFKNPITWHSTHSSMGYLISDTTNCIKMVNFRKTTISISAWIPCSM